MARLRSNTGNFKKPSLYEEVETFTTDSTALIQPIPEPLTIEVIKYVEVPVEKIVEKRVEVPVSVIEYVDRIVPRVEYKTVDVPVPYAVQVTKEVEVEKLITEFKVPMWAWCTIAIQFMTIATLIWQG